MVKSPKSGRELEGAEFYTGPEWFVKFVRRHLEGRQDDEDR